jgi:hypothetical protein
VPLDLSKLRPGLYVVVRPKMAGLVTHVGLLDVGNRLGLNANARCGPLVLHQPLTGLVANYAGQAGTWETAVAVTNVSGVRERVINAFQDRTYDLFGSNCEHFVNFALSGEKKSPQLRTVAAIIGLAIAAALLFNSGSGRAAPRGA